MSDTGQSPPPDPDGHIPSPWPSAGQAPDPSHPGPRYPVPPPLSRVEPQPKTPIVVGALAAIAAVLLSTIGLLTLGSGQRRIPVFVLSAPLWLVPIVGFVLLFPERTRRWGLGVLLGFALSFVIGFVACVGVLFAFSKQSGQGA